MMGSSECGSWGRALWTRLARGLGDASPEGGRGSHRGIQGQLAGQILDERSSGEALSRARMTSMVGRGGLLPGSRPIARAKAQACVFFLAAARQVRRPHRRDADSASVHAGTPRAQSSSRSGLRSMILSNCISCAVMAGGVGSEESGVTGGVGQRRSFAAACTTRERPRCCPGRQGGASSFLNFAAASAAAHAVACRTQRIATRTRSTSARLMSGSKRVAGLVGVLRIQRTAPAQGPVSIPQRGGLRGYRLR